MIIIELFAGLGNQLFQYAAGRALAEELKVPLLLNLQSFAKSEIYQYELGPFNISAGFATKKEVDKALNLPKNILSKYFLKITERLKPSNKRRSIIREKSFHFENEMSATTKNAYLFGHWQSEKYFINHRDLIRREFALKTNHLDKRVDLINKIENTNSFSLVIRRGDYLTYADLNLYGDDLTFYYKAINYAQSKISDPHFFIFSDDIEWVKQHLNIILPVTFVSEPYPGIDYKINPNRHQDLHLISKCKHHIITNSTFAWWGAWLNPSKNKMVIAPSQWFAKDKIWYDGNIANTQDILPDEWIKI